MNGCLRNTCSLCSCKEDNGANKVHDAMKAPQPQYCGSIVLCCNNVAYPIHSAGRWPELRCQHNSATRKKFHNPIVKLQKAKEG